MVVLKANQLPAFIPRSRVRMSVHQTWNSAERKSMKLRIAGDSPRRGRKDGVDNSARQRPVREDDVQRAGRDLIHHNVVRELRNANAVRRKAYMSSAAYRGSNATLTRWPAASRNSQAWLGGARKRSSPGSRLNSAGVVGRPSWQGGTPDQELPTLGKPLHDQSLVLEGVETELQMRRIDEHPRSAPQLWRKSGNLSPPQSLPCRRAGSSKKRSLQLLAHNRI